MLGEFILAGPYVSPTGGSGSDGDPSACVTVAVYDFDAEEYPARPNAVLVYWVGPVEPPEWAGFDEWRQADEPPGPPGAPTDLVAVAGDEEADLSWSAPADDGGSAITGYIIVPYILGVAQTPVTVGAVTSHTVSSLTNGTTYSFTVAAVNAIGTGPASDPSNEVTPVVSSTVPGAPTGVTATAGSGQATVGWIAPASDGGAAITGYTITPYIGLTAQTPTTVGDILSTTITGLTNGSTYTFKVAAINAIGTGVQSAASSSVTPTAGYIDIVKVQQKTEKRQPSGANVSVTLDVAPTVGNVLVGCFTSVLNASITPPSGWTLVDSRTSGAFFVGIYERVVVGGDTAGPYVWTPGANSVMEATIIEFSGVDTSTPFVTPLTGFTAVPGSTSAPLGPTGAPSLPKAAAVAVVGVDGNVTFSNTWTGGFTKLTGSGILYQEVATRIDNSSPSAYSTAEGWSPGRSVGAFIAVLRAKSL